MSDFDKPTAVGSANITDGSIVDADINASAAIAVSKLAAKTASRAVVTDSSGFIAAATTTSTEIGYVNGVTSAIQTQLGTKAPIAGPSFTGNVTVGTTDLFVDGTGHKVGIGVATPTICSLHVNSETAGAHRAIRMTNASDLPAAGSTGFELGVDGGGFIVTRGAFPIAIGANSGVNLSVTNIGNITMTPTSMATVAGDFKLTTAGNTFFIKEGTNATMGTLTLNGSTEVTVSTTKVTASSRIFLTIQAPGGTPAGIAYVSSRSAGASFGVKGIVADTSTVAWLIVEPA